MTGYHFTSFKEWQSIKKEGLKPYLLPPDILEELINNNVNYIAQGIFVFEEQQTGISRLGCLIRQLAFKNSTKLVELEVKYSYSDTMGLGSTRLHIDHEGVIENFIYHKKASGRVLFKPIAPDKIKLLKSYDLMDIIKAR